MRMLWNSTTVEVCHKLAGVACLVGGDCATVKRFKRSKKSIYLVPENEEYQPIKLTTDDFESGEARILGIACEIKIKL